tara:strand:+ start:5544 stop:6653 length:1110 start_codon:yes stop_codon:yes gene_type:complete
MAKYHLVHIESKGTFFNLTRLEMVNKLKQGGDLQNWFCWYPGIVQWKQVSRANEVREWMSNTWTEDQPMPAWQDLFNQRARSEAQDFEVVEFNETPASLTPPPLPTEQKTEFVVSGFSGQVFDFDESLKDKHLNSTGFKIIKDDGKNADEVNKFEGTVKVDTTAADFEKTVSASTQLVTEGTVKVETSGADFEKTQTAITAAVPENTSKINITEVEPVTGKFDPVPDMTITKELPVLEKTAPPQPVTLQTTTPDAAAANNASKKHNRRYPRIKGRLRTIITNKSKAFMTFTKDISLGGIWVENNIPQDILNSEIEVYVSDPTGKKSILFRCHPVGDLKSPCRFSFAKADEKNLQKLSQWLDDLAKMNAA